MLITLFVQILFNNRIRYMNVLSFQLSFLFSLFIRFLANWIDRAFLLEIECFAILSCRKLEIRDSCKNQGKNHFAFWWFHLRWTPYLYEEVLFRGNIISEDWYQILREDHKAPQYFRLTCSFSNHLLSNARGQRPVLESIIYYFQKCYLKMQASKCNEILLYLFQ